jgi:hypothetical protein
MTAAHFEDHPTDPDKVILRKKPYLDKGADYEHGFIDGMQYQMQSSVDKAVNAMTGKQPSAPWNTTPPQRTWVGLTDEDFRPAVQKAMVYYGYKPEHSTLTSGAGFYELVRAIEARLKEKNT